MIRWLLQISVSILIGISLPELSAFAEGDAAPAPSSEKVDAILVLDQSGSMLATDPQKLRVEGAKLFTQFLKKGDRLGIVSFAEDATVVRPLSDFDSSQIESIGSMIEEIPATGQYTDIAAGINKAVSILSSERRDGVNTTIILMSDGKMEPPAAHGAVDMLTQNLTEITLPELKKQETKVYTLAFSDQADKEFLQEIAALTDAISWYTPNADKIHESFANLFLAVKKPQLVPMTKRGFKIDGDVQEATFYINREDSTGEIALINPAGEEISKSKLPPDVKWFSGQKFEVVTIPKPVSGDWQITGVAHQDGFATVLTKLRLISEWPTSLYAQGKTLLEARLYEDDKPIVLPEMSQAITFAFQVTPTDKVSEPTIRDFLADDGKNGDKVAKDGVFSKIVEIEDAGEYKLRVLAKAPTFERNQQMPFRVKPPMIQIGITEVEQKVFEPVSEDGHEAEAHDDEDHRHEQIEAFVVTLNDDTQALKKTSVDVIAVGDKGLRIKIPVVRGKDSKTKFFANPADLPKHGAYTMTGILNGETKRAQEIRSESRPLKYNYHVEHASDEEPMMEVVKKEIAKPEKVGFPYLPILLLTLLNGAAFYKLMQWAEKAQTGGGDSKEKPTFSSTLGSEQLLKRLQDAAGDSDVDLDSKYFSMKEDELPPIWTSVVGASMADPQLANQTTSIAQAAPAEQGEASAEEASPAAVESEATTSEAQAEPESTEEQQ